MLEIPGRATVFTLSDSSIRHRLLPWSYLLPRRWPAVGVDPVLVAYLRMEDRARYEDEPCVTKVRYRELGYQKARGQLERDVAELWSLTCGHLRLKVLELARMSISVSLFRACRLSQLALQLLSHFFPLAKGINPCGYNSTKLYDCSTYVNKRSTVIGQLIGPQLLSR